MTTIKAQSRSMTLENERHIFSSNAIIKLNSQNKTAIKYPHNGTLSSKELEASILAYELGIGPKVLWASSSQLVTELIVEFELGWWGEYSHPEVISLVHKFEKMHLLGFAHGDPHEDNVLWVPRLEEFVVIDWGMAEFAKYNYKQYIDMVGRDLEFLSETLFLFGTSTLLEHYASLAKDDGIESETRRMFHIVRQYLHDLSLCYNI